jgi:hypothetical protein
VRTTSPLRSVLHRVMDRWREERSLRFAAVAIALLVTCVASVAVVKGAVRSRVRARAAAHGLQVDVGEVSLGWFSVTLRGLEASQGGGHLRVRAPSVRVELSAGLSPRLVHVDHPRIDLSGTATEIGDALEAVRARSRSGEAAPGQSPIRWGVSGLELHWAAPDGSSFDVEGATIDREGVQTAVRVASITARRGGRTLRGERAEVSLGAGGTVATARLASLALELAREEALAPSLTHPSPSAADPEPPPAPGAPPSAPSPFVPLIHVPDLGPVEALRRAVAAAVAERIPDGATYAVDAFSVSMTLGGKPLTVGPGTIAVERTGDRLVTSFASPGSGGSAPLALRLDAALSSGPSTVNLSGGPVSLATLGVREHMGGFLDVERGRVGGRGTVTLEEGARRVAFDVDVALESLTIDQPKLAREPVRGLSFSVRAAGSLSHDGALALDRASFDMGQLHAEAKATMSPRAGGGVIRADLSLARASCQGLLDSVPRALVPTASQLSMTGTVGAVASFEVDTTDVDAMQVRYDVDERCRVTETAPELARAHFEGPFLHQAHHPDGVAYDFSTGRGTAEWVDLGEISPYMTAAVLTTEDGAFYKHHGFNHAAIRDSIRANVKAGRFVRGASTISMQLAKNLFLSREKTLARKLEELVLTSYLEQQWTKDELMELYLNVVELGPDVYGVRAAADHYFGRTPAELSIAESLFLASLLPAPVRYHKLSEKDRLSDRWLSHLRSLMRIAHKRGTLTAAELEGGLAQEVEFHRAGDPPPTPRPMPRGQRPRAGWSDEDPTDPGTD